MATGGSETYYAFEINFAGEVLSNRARFGGHFDFTWDASEAFQVGDSASYTIIKLGERGLSAWETVETMHFKSF